MFFRLWGRLIACRRLSGGALVEAKLLGGADGLAVCQRRRRYRWPTDVKHHNPSVSEGALWSFNPIILSGF
jgi:hypothetical protein